MKDEVEDFLRRVAQMRAQAEAQAKTQQQRPGQQRSEQQRSEQQRPPRPAPRPPVQPPPPPPRLAQTPSAYAQPVPAEVVDAELAESADRIGREVAAHLRGSEQIAQHTQQLGHEVDLADDKLEARLHETFDHDLGRLRKAASSTAATPHVAPVGEVTSSEVLAMLRSPQTIRDVIVMSEILRRPEWW
jgi:hypothetical protein